MRKIIQLLNLEGALVALCNDGTVWEYFDGYGEGLEEGWGQFKPIPQNASDPDVVAAAQAVVDAVRDVVPMPLTLG